MVLRCSGVLVLGCVSLFVAACSTAPGQLIPVDLNPLAERYVKLVLAVGQHDADYVDAYYGDPSWRPTGAPVPLLELAASARTLRGEVEQAVLASDAEEIQRLRREYLARQLAAVEARLAMLGGEKLSFDEESRRLYDAVAPRHAETDFQAALDELGRLLPGAGSILTRYEAYQQQFVIPADRLDRVFRAAVDGCRARTLEHVTLPAGEAFTIEYVKGKSWSAYNWYKGNFTSLIQVNTDLPVQIDRAIDLACHEGYPGHHVYNALLEKALVRDRGWVEFSVYPLFSPQSLIAEGTANFGIDVAFPGEARAAFERDVLYPLAGLDPSMAERHARVRDVVGKLNYAGNEAARRYLDGEIDRAQAVAWLERYALSSKPRAEQRTRFFDQYRSYVINYNLGQDLTRAYIERQGGVADKPDVRWREFVRLLSSPRLPSGLN
jgi:hypothetical protein